jgi:selenocysteine-specific elongation factor
MEAWHRDKPDAVGANDVALMRALPLRCRRAAFEHVVAGLIESGEIVRAGAVLQRRGYQGKLTDFDEKQWRRIRSIMDEAESRPPTISEISEELGTKQNQIGGLLARAAKVGLVTRVSANRYLTIETLRALAGVAEKGARDLPSGRFTVAAYRDWSGMGRNLSIEILEFFDKLNFTRRVGNEREILKPAARVFGAEI